MVFFRASLGGCSFFYPGQVCFTIGSGIFFKEGKMETRIAAISIIVEDPEEAVELNEILHAFREYIIGRMGIPYRERKLSLISVFIDAPQDIVAALSGKLGNLSGVSVKTNYAKM